MPTASDAYEAIRATGISFFAGVPDSLLKALGAHLSRELGESDHVIAANEGGAIALAAGHYLATGRPGAVYLQNSGLGNAINPLVSLADPEVYGIPMLVIVGWRGEPGTVDEPQHQRQGRATIPTLDAIGVPWAIADADAGAFAATVRELVDRAVSESRPTALVVPKGVIDGDGPRTEDGDARMTREAAIAMIVDGLPPDAVVVATTGKTSRELFEHRIAGGSPIERDLLMVGSMGHASQAALGIAIASPDRPVWILDGDGAALMHLGGMAVIGEHTPANLHHVILNNGVHDSVGGQPTPSTHVDFVGVASALGYTRASSVRDRDDLATVVAEFGETNGPTFLEVIVRPGARSDLGRPTSSPAENKQALMRSLAR